MGANFYREIMSCLFKVLIISGLCVFMSLTFGKAQTAEDFLKSGNQNLKAEKYLEAKKDYEKALALNPKSAQAHHNLGDVLYILGEYAQALTRYTQAISLSPQDAEPYCSRGALYFEMRKFKEAQADADQAIALKPNFVNAHFLSGNIKWATQQKNEACQDWKQALALGHPEARAKIEKYCAGIAQIAPSREFKISKKKPENAQEFCKSAEKKLEARDYEGAIQDYQKAIELNVQYAEAYFGMGNAYFAQGEPEQACQKWRKALELGYTQAQEMLKGVCQD
ncbi:MAG: tetratricopeptide repeat protein [Microscillaceae bacterium]|jgi:tetratricopeptide (TPR) repeat protein|nr:tetratricopeptide repeat protein [Microscillaceae bacterium]